MDRTVRGPAGWMLDEYPAEKEGIPGQPRNAWVASQVVQRSFPLFSALLILAVVAPGCSGEAEEVAPPATLGTAPPTTTGEPIDPAVIPDDPADIDEAYVQAVVDALFEVDAEATRIFLETGTVDERGIDYLEAIYVPEELERQVNIWSEDLELRSTELLPGVLRNDIQRVIDVADDCIYVEAVRDYSETTTRDAPLRPVFLGLTPRLEEDEGEDQNPTAWMMFMDGLNADGSEPGNPCEGR